MFSLLFENSAETADVVAMGHLEGRVNYLKGNNKSKWNINIPTFRETLYKGIYEGIDLRIYGNGQSLEYDFIVNPGADPGKIQLASEGIKGLIINHEGDLLIRTPFGRLKVSKPSIYQEIEGKRVEIAGGFRFMKEREVHGGSVVKQISAGPSEDTVGYKLSQINTSLRHGFYVVSYDPAYPLVIDPELLYSAYLGGNEYDFGYGIAVDGSGNAYVTGETTSSNFPTESPFRGSQSGGYDAFVTKLKPDGNELVYSTYLGGNGSDHGRAIAVDGSGNAYVTGDTSSNDFPPSPESSYQEELAGKRDAFVIKMAGDEKGNAGSIDGYVYSKSFEPIASATVKLKDIITKEQEKRITENNGFFIFTNLESGTYNLKAKKGKKKVESELITLSEEDPNVRVVLVLD